VGIVSNYPAARTDGGIEPSGYRAPVISWPDLWRACFYDLKDDADVWHLELTSTIKDLNGAEITKAVRSITSTSGR
jgi:hypothetical protein